MYKKVDSFGELIKLRKKSLFRRERFNNAIKKRRFKFIGDLLWQIRNTPRGIKTGDVV